MSKKLTYLCSFVLVLVAVPIVTHAQVDNLLQNPSFEEDEIIQADPAWERWTTWGWESGLNSTVAFDETEFIDGKRSLRVEPTGGTNWYFMVLQDSIPLTVDQPYTSSFWAKAEEPRPLTAKMKATDNSIDWGLTDFELTSEWAEYTMTSEAMSASAKFEIHCAAVEVPLWLDFVFVYEGEYVAGIEPSGISRPEKAADPDPADGALLKQTWLNLSWTPGQYANQHDVYFGTSFDDVNNTTNLDPMGPDKVYRARQSVNSYAVPERLDFGQTYYWRIDEVNAPPTSHVVFKGDVWTFTVEPIGYAIENITATASSSHAADMGPENTINGSGLDANDLHSNKPTDMWLSGIEPLGAWIEYEFDKVYKLHQMWVWNSDQAVEPLVGFGLKDVTIEYSANGTDYTTLGTTHEFAQAPGTTDYAHNTSVDMGGATAKHVKLTANSNWAGIMPQYGLSEVRFLYIPVRARQPNPDSGATDVDVDMVLSWVAGREAAEHNVYVNSDEQAVIDRTAPVFTVAEPRYGPLSLDLSMTYYWKINEVNMAETPTTWDGDLWSFTTREFIVVDDFESYNDLDPDDPESNRIFNSWTDGYEVPTNGSLVGYENPPFCERTIVHNGKQSMPLAYSNTGTAAYSEAERTFAVGQNWTQAGATTLVLFFHGTEGNTGQLYVKVNGAKVVYGGDVGDIAKPQWNQWNINLAALGVDLQNVTKLSIGIDDSGASGTLYLDDIRLYRLAP